MGRVSIFVRFAGLEAHGFLADKTEHVPGFRMAKDLVQRRHIDRCINDKSSQENAQAPGESRRTSILPSVRQVRCNRPERRMKNRFGDSCSSTILRTLNPDFFLKKLSRASSRNGAERRPRVWCHNGLIGLFRDLHRQVKPANDDDDRYEPPQQPRVLEEGNHATPPSQVQLSTFDI